MSTESEKQIIIGKFGSPYGVKGWVKLNSFTNPIDNILNYQPWQIDYHGKTVECRLENAKPHDKAYVVKLEGCDDRDLAATYTNCQISIAREQLPTPEQDEHYWTDLVGLSVYDQNDELLGQVDHLMETGSNDVMFVKGNLNEYIPFIDDVITEVDIKSKKILVNWTALANEDT